MKISPRLRGDRKVYAEIDKYRRPLRNKDEIRASLIDNFHWTLQSKRKQLNLTRRQVANSISSSEEDIKQLENGVLPAHDYILINKLEDYYHINLRKDPNAKVNLSTLGSIKREKPNFLAHANKDNKERADTIIGDSKDIEIIDDSDKD